MDDAAPHCALVLIEHGKGKRKRLTSSRQRACEYVIDHAIGKATMKIKHSGGIITYGEILKGAETLDKKPRPILAEVMEIANKHQEREALTQNVEESNEVKGDKNTPVDGAEGASTSHDQGP